MQKKAFQILATFLLMLIVPLFPFSDGHALIAWNGVVLDKKTREPVVGAVVVRSWDRVCAGPAGRVSSFEKAKEALSGRNGGFMIFDKGPSRSISVFCWSEENNTLVFKPGYKFLELQEKSDVIELEKIPTLLDMRKEEVRRARGNYEIYMWDTKIFRDIIIKEEEFVESSKHLVPIVKRSPNGPPSISLPRRKRIGGSDIGQAPVLKNPPPKPFINPDHHGTLEGISMKMWHLYPNRVEPTIDHLINSLKHEDWQTRRWAARALGEVKATKGVDALINTLKDGHPLVRKSAAAALGKIQHPRAIESLIQTLKDKDSGVRGTAVTILSKIGYSAAEPLFKAMKSEDPRIRKGATIVLGTIGDPRARESLVALLQDKEPYVVLRAITALALIKEQVIAEALVAALDRVDDNMRVTIGHSLRKIGPPAVEPLIGALKNRDPHIRMRVAWFLGWFEDPRVVKCLVSALKEDENWRVRRSAAGALGVLGDPKAVKPLIASLIDYDVDVRKRTAEALVQIGRLSVDPLIKVLDEDDYYLRWRAAWCLGKIKDSKAVEALILKLGDHVSEVRWTVIGALGEIGDKRAFKELVVMVEDPDLGIKQRAEWALKQIGEGEVK